MHNRKSDSIGCLRYIILYDFLSLPSDTHFATFDVSALPTPGKWFFCTLAVGNMTPEMIASFRRRLLFFVVVLSCLNLLAVAPISGHSWLLAPSVLWFCLNAIANKLPRLCPLCLPMSTINNISGPICYLFCSYTFRLVPHSRYHVPLIVVLSISQRKRFVP